VLSKVLSEPTGRSGSWGTAALNRKWTEMCRALGHRDVNQTREERLQESACRQDTVSRVPSDLFRCSLRLSPHPKSTKALFTCGYRLASRRWRREGRAPRALSQSFLTRFSSSVERRQQHRPLRLARRGGDGPPRLTRAKTRNRDGTFENKYHKTAMRAEDETRCIYRVSPSLHRWHTHEPTVSFNKERLSLIVLLTIPALLRGLHPHSDINTFRTSFIYEM